MGKIKKLNTWIGENMYFVGTVALVWFAAHFAICQYRLPSEFKGGFNDDMIEMRARQDKIKFKMDNTYIRQMEIFSSMLTSLPELCNFDKATRIEN